MNKNKIVNNVIFKDMLEILSDRERKMIELYYFKDLREVDIAKMFKVSHQMINKVKLRAVRKMTKYLTK
jgi:RNA polymerase sporulation-specific sigma factor